MSNESDKRDLQPGLVTRHLLYEDHGMLANLVWGLLAVAAMVAAPLGVGSELLAGAMLLTWFVWTVAGCMVGWLPPRIH